MSPEFCEFILERTVRATHIMVVSLPWWKHRLRYRRRLGRAPTWYRGARVPRDGRVAVLNTVPDARAFFDRFIRRRRPVVIRCPLPEFALLPEGWWTGPPARSLAVQVEVRDGASDTFGKGRKVAMTFGELLDAQSPDHYLTTQPLPDGHLVAPPLTAFADQMPLRPALMGSLVPQSINLWLGRSIAPASSGLHHDFHDNLYVLLRGTKHFRLFSPADARRMYTYGRLRLLHANGRINYAGDEPTAADGRTAMDAAEEALRAAKRAQKRAERRLFEAEAAADEDANARTQAELDEAESAMEAAMDRCVHAMRRCKGARRAAQRKLARDVADAPPPSFSRVADLEAELAAARASHATAAFPLLAAARLAECDLQAGDMLYLPAGWFHEVSSSGAHCALNYWYHPPPGADAQRTGSFSFECPYGKAQAFWEREWGKAAAQARSTVLGGSL